MAITPGESSEAHSRYQQEQELESIWPTCSEVIARYLRGRGLQRDQVDDAVQELFVRIWERRESLSFNPLPRFLTYLKRVADSIIYVRRPERLQIPLAEVPEEAESEDLGHQIGSVLQTGQLLTYIDDELLGEAPDQLSQRLLLAHLVLVDGVKPAEALSAVGLPHSFSNKIIRQQIGHPRILSETYSRSLSLSCPQLVGLLLGVEEHELGDVFGARNRAEGWGSWSPLELCWLLIKCLDFLPSAHLKAQTNSEDIARLDDFLLRLREQMPFIPIVHALQSAISQNGLSDISFNHDLLWRRIIFHYDVEGMPQEDMVAWLAGAASMQDVSITSTRLRYWISMHAVARQIQGRIAEDTEG